MLTVEIAPAESQRVRQQAPQGQVGQSSEVTEKRKDSGCEEGDLNPHGCYPTSPSN